MRALLLTLIPSIALAAPRAADTERPLKWLIAAQNENGGWGPEAKSNPDVATTAISGIALIRMGHTYAKGEYSAATKKAVEFVVRAVEKTPGNDHAINAAGTQPQAKLGRYIDTFVGAQFLSEVMPSMPSGEMKDRARSALDVCVDKIQAVQRQDGSFSPDGWAPVLSSAFASGGLYAAQRAGSTHVKAAVLEKANSQMLKSYNTTTKKFETGASAGVELYQAAGTAQAAAREGKMGGDAGKAAMARLNDENFVRGFGSYGGEEHVSYMMTSEALASVGGTDWQKWDEAIRTRLAAIQRQDGTWRGDHCITSTSFCTAASLITLMIKHDPKAQKRT